MQIYKILLNKCLYYLYIKILICECNIINIGYNSN